MKIQLPNGRKITLDENITLEAKIQVVEDLTVELMPILLLNWHSNSVKFFLDNLSNYLVWHKEDEEKNKQDKDVLSIRRIEEMEGKRKNRTTPFTGLSLSDRDSLGIGGGING